MSLCDDIKSPVVFIEIQCNTYFVLNTTTILPSFFLFFSVPPGRPLIHNERGIAVESTLGPYNEGSILRLTCSVSGGKNL